MGKAPLGICLITGAAHGIGAATARAAAQNGYALAINYLEARKEAEALVAAIVGGGGKAIAVQADIGRADEVARLFAAVDAELGPVTALVNNAGISGGRAALVDIDPATIERVVGTNLAGTLFCTREAVRRMARSHGGKGGAIVNLSSIVTRTGGYRIAAYTATKAAIEGVTKALAIELAEEGIRVNAVSPGVVATRQNEGRGADTAARIPLGRLGAPEEVAKAILWLLSDAASYVTGTTLDVSGGR